MSDDVSPVHPTRERIARRWSVARVVTFLIALLLVTAAALKLWPVLDPREAVWLTASQRALDGGEAAFELLLAGWLVSSKWPRAAWGTAILTFLGFALFTAARAMAGEASCGCFGKLEVDPRITLALDLGVVFALALAGPATRRTAPAAPFMPLPA